LKSLTGGTDSTKENGDDTTAFDDDLIPDQSASATKGKGGIIGFLVAVVVLAVVGIAFIVWLRKRSATNSVHNPLMNNKDMYQSGESSTDMTAAEVQQSQQRVAISEA
jgi:hypothetical protein